VVFNGTVTVAGVIATEVTVVLFPPPPHACKLQPPAITRAIMARRRFIGDRRCVSPHNPVALCAAAHFPTAFTNFIGFGLFIETLSPRGFKGCREVPF
jgi:hypothetical protein